MIKKSKIIFSTLVILSFSTTEVIAATAAGRVILSSGQFSATGPNGQRTLSRGSEVYSGETLVTGDNSNAQVRFSDNSMISLSPGTRYRVNNYNYTPSAPAKGNYSASILKGGVKTLTGKIAKDNSSNYSLQSPVATIGVRGTFYGVAYDEKEGQSTSAWQGSVEMKNAAGSIQLGPGEATKFASASSADQAPQGTATESNQLVRNLNPPGFTSLQQRTEASNQFLTAPSFVRLQAPVNPLNINLYQPTTMTNQITFFPGMGIIPPS